ncbi:MAG: D-aminoacylase [Acidobacteria bacterium]|nr:D-aminoacylase [Acidobacteriota bacterium]
MTVLALLLGMLVIAGCKGTSDTPDESILIRGATVVDGTGAPGVLASVRIVGDRISAVGELEPRRGEIVVFADGKVLTPGFIDTHSHHDDGLLENREARAAVSQGITTIVAGQDGDSPYPIADFFAEIEAQPPAVNVAAYAGHNTLRGETLGEDFRRPATANEVTRMGSMLEEEMAAGALGLATGLEYDPGIYSETGEVVALAKIAAKDGGRYISHIRSEDRFFWDAIEEILRIGREARIPVQISHMKLAMKSLWGQTERLLERLDRARDEGIDVTADVYPYTYWQSTMTVLFPERDFDNRDTAAFALSEIATPEGILVGRFDPEPSYVGLTIAEIADLRGSDAVTTYIELIAEAQELHAETGERGESIVATSMTEEDVAKLIAWPHSNICSDGELDGRHPRGYGTFPRVLGRYVRELGAIGLEEAIHKMTALSAGHMGLRDRGVLRAGAYADLVLLDANVVDDRATPGEPQAVSVGIDQVWVNGKTVWVDGDTTGAHPGRALRRESP